MFDEACLTPLPNYTGRQIRRIRERENVSQVVFAHYLAVSKNLVSDCERGIKKPAPQLTVEAKLTADAVLPVLSAARAASLKVSMPVTEPIVAIGA